MADPAAKLREARFFLRLLQHLESNASPLLVNSAVRDEFAFVLSALLNAFYAATEHLKPVAGEEAVKAFKREHAIIFDGKTGLRNLTVHERHVSPALAPYVTPRGGSVNLVFSDPATNSSDLVFRSEYYVEAGTEPLHINSLCRQQYHALQAFARTHGVATEA